jgi:hypothetical protein
MGVRQELEMLDILLADISRYQKNLIGFKNLYSTLRSISEAIIYLNKEVKIELEAYANSLEAVGVYPQGDYKHFVQSQEEILVLPSDEQEAVNKVLSDISSLLIRVKSQTNLMYCRSCGYDLSDLPKKDSPQKCPCCGIPIDALNLSDQEIAWYRDRWLEHPTHWYDPSVYPKDWEIGEQLQRVSID